jgi:glycosyltransferase involved in cell wall biosynthesis
LLLSPRIGNRDDLRGEPITSPPATIRVLHVINGEHYAGAERVQDLLAMRLPEFGVEVNFACVKPKRFAEMRRSQLTPLTNVPMRSRFDLRAGWRLARLVRENQINLIHTHTPRAALVGQIAARLTSVPMVHHVHGHTATEVGSGWRVWLSAKTEAFSLQNASAVIVVSPTSAQYIYLWGVREDRVHLVPNGVPGRIDLVDLPAPHEQWTLGCVALFRPRKGLEILLEAMALLHRRGLPVYLRLIGGFETPEYQEQVLRLAEELGIAKLVEWRGFRKNIEAELDAIDLMILPSVLAEGMPMAVLEAMAAGVPPIGSRVDGIADVIRHGHDGLLVEPGDAEKLADTVTAVIEGSHDWQTLRHNAITSHQARFSDRSMAERVAEVYRSVLTQTKPQMNADKR